MTFLLTALGGFCVGASVVGVAAGWLFVKLVEAR